MNTSDRKVVSDKAPIALTAQPHPLLPPPTIPPPSPPILRRRYYSAGPRTCLNETCDSNTSDCPLDVIFIVVAFLFRMASESRGTLKNKNTTRTKKNSCSNFIQEIKRFHNLLFKTNYNFMH